MYLVRTGIDNLLTGATVPGKLIFSFFKFFWPQCTQSNQLVSLYLHMYMYGTGRKIDNIDSFVLVPALKVPLVYRYSEE